jgi:hypothetical protein
MTVRIRTFNHDKSVMNEFEAVNIRYDKADGIWSADDRYRADIGYEFVVNHDSKDDEIDGIETVYWIYYMNDTGDNFFVIGPPKNNVSK